MTPAGPPSKGWWVIMDGAAATAFRSRIRESLLTTLYQLQQTQPGVALRWVERNRVWESPEAARAAFAAERMARRPKMPAGWRPGGDHRDPRARYELTRDQKRARFKTTERQGGPPGRPEGPGGRPPGGPSDRRDGLRDDLQEALGTTALPTGCSSDRTLAALRLAPIGPASDGPPGRPPGDQPTGRQVAARQGPRRRPPGH